MTLLSEKVDRILAKRNVAGKLASGVQQTFQQTFPASRIIPFAVKQGIKAAPYARESVRGARDIILSSPQVMGSLIQELGERAEELPDLGPTPSNMIFPMLPLVKMAKSALFKRTDRDEQLADVGRGLIERNKKWIAKRIPDYGPSGKGQFKDFMYSLGSGATTMAAALGITALTRTPHAAAALFGLYQKGQLYQTGREKGLTPQRAGELSTLGGAIEGALEYIGLDFLLKRYGGRLMTTFIRSGTEALQEWSQQTGENLVVKLGGIDKKRSIFQGSGMAALVGLTLGAPTSISIDMAEKSGILGELQQSGLTLQESRKVLTFIVDSQKKRLANIITSEAGFARVSKGTVPKQALDNAKIMLEGGSSPQSVLRQITKGESWADKFIEAYTKQFGNNPFAEEKVEALPKFKPADYRKQIQGVADAESLDRIVTELRDWDKGATPLQKGAIGKLVKQATIKLKSLQAPPVKPLDIGVEKPLPMEETLLGRPSAEELGLSKATINAENIERLIIEQGGLTPYAGGKEMEEFRGHTNLRIRRKGGSTPDKMAQQLGLEGGDQELYALLDEAKELRTGRKIEKQKIAGLKQELKPPPTDEFQTFMRDKIKEYRAGKMEVQDDLQAKLQTPLTAPQRKAIQNFLDKTWAERGGKPPELEPVSDKTLEIEPFSDTDYRKFMKDSIKNYRETGKTGYLQGIQETLDTGRFTPSQRKRVQRWLDKIDRELRQKSVSKATGLTDKIQAREGGNAKEKYGASFVMDVSDEDLAMSMGKKFGEVASDLLQTAKEAIHSTELMHNYLRANPDSKPFTLAIENIMAKALAYRKTVDVTERLMDAAKNSKALAEIFVAADRDNSVDIDSILENALREGRITEKEFYAGKAYVTLHKFAYNRIVEEIMESRLGVRVRSKGKRYRVVYNTKKGVSEKWVTGPAKDNLKSKFPDMEVLEEKEQITIKRVDPETGQYVEESRYIDDYLTEVPEILSEENRQLIKELLPWGPGQYITHSRAQGKYWVTISGEVDPETGKQEMMYSARVPSLGYANRLKELSNQQFPERVVNIGLDAPLSMDFYMGNVLDVTYWLNQRGIDLKSEEAQKIINAYRGMSTLLSHINQDTGIPGYRVDWEGISKGMVDIAKSAVGRVRANDLKELKSKVPKVGTENITTLKESRQVRDKAFRTGILNDYLDLLLEDERGNVVLDTANALVYFAALANSPLFAIQNVTEVYWSWTMAFDRAKDKVGFLKPLEEEYRRLLLKAKEEGLIKSYMKEQIRGKADDLLEHADMIGKRTDAWSSRQTFKFGLALARDAGLHDDAAYEYAWHFLNEGKPFYKGAVPVFMRKRGWGIVRRSGLIFMKWVMDWINKFARGTLGQKLLWLLGASMMAGVPFGRRLVKKKMKKGLLDRFLIAGFPGILGVSAKFLAPVSLRGFESGISIRSLTMLADKAKRAKIMYDRYGPIGALTTLPLAGTQFFSKGMLFAAEGVKVKRGKAIKTIYKPHTLREKIMLSLGLTPFELGEAYERTYGKKTKPFKFGRKKLGAGRVRQGARPDYHAIVDKLIAERKGL